MQNYRISKHLNRTSRAICSKVIRAMSAELAIVAFASQCGMTYESFTNRYFIHIEVVS
jgi:hypothetical protein